MDGRSDKQKMNHWSSVFLIVCISFLASESLMAQVTYEISSQSGDTVDLSPFITYFQEDAQQSLSFWQVQQKAFKPLETGKRLRANDRPIWIQFQLHNRLADSVHYNLYLGRHKRLRCWMGNKGERISKTGLYIPFSQWTNQFRPWYIPIHLAGGEAQIYMVKVEDFMETGRKIHLDLVSKSLEFDLIGRKLVKHRFEFFSSIFVVGVTIFLCCFTFIQFISFRDKVYLFYSLYLLMMSLQFVKALDYTGVFRVLFVHLGILNLYMDVLIDIVPLFFYAAFVLQILNIQTEAPQTYQQIQRFLGIIGLLLAVNMLFLFTEQYWLANRCFLLTWVIQTCGSIWFLQIIYSRLSYPFAKYILLGSFCLLMGAAISFGISFLKRQFGLSEHYPTIAFMPLIPLRLGFLIEILCFSFTLGLRMKENERQKEKVRHDLEHNKMALLQTELKALKAQMNPHFVSNCLNSIKALIQDQRTEEAITYLVQFSKLIRSIVDYSLRQEITLPEELELAKLYLDLEALRLGHSFRYEADWEHSKADLDFFKVPPFLLQPFLENAIWHGFSRESRAEYILTISVEEREEGLCCIIDDNGIGRKQAATRQHKQKANSIGIRNVQERLTLLKTLEETEMHIEVIDKYQENGQAAGTRVEVWLMY